MAHAQTDGASRTAACLATVAHPEITETRICLWDVDSAQLENEETNSAVRAGKT